MGTRRPVSASTESVKSFCVVSVMTGESSQSNDSEMTFVLKVRLVLLE